jgi:site-specific recombinase XerD
MENIQLRYAFDRRKVADNSSTKGLLQIEVRLTGTNVRKLFSTGIYLHENQFSAKNGFTCRNHPNAPAVTGEATRMFRKIEAFALSEKCTRLEDVKNWDRDEAAVTSVVDFMLSALRQKNPTSAVLSHHGVLIRQIAAFGKIKTFADVTYTNIVEFDGFLRRTIQSQPILYKRHSTFKFYIVDAINRGLCKSNPYIQFKIQRGKSRPPTFLDEDEIRRIMEYKTDIARMEHVRDLFVFQCFTGLACVDLMNFTPDSVSDRDGMKVMRSNRTKTDESFVTLLLPEAQQIAEKYDWELPKLSNQKYNDYLKILAVGAGIKKNLTSHVARHTFATYLINKNIPIESVSKALGHASIRQTQHYARLAGKKVIEDMKSLLNK